MRLYWPFGLVNVPEKFWPSWPFEPLQAYETPSAAVNFVPPFGHAGSSPGASARFATLMPSRPSCPSRPSWPFRPSSPFEPLQAKDAPFSAVNLLPPFGHAGSSPGARVWLVTLTPSCPLTPAVFQLMGMSPGWHALRPLSPRRYRVPFDGLKHASIVSVVAKAECPTKTAATSAPPRTNAKTERRRNRLMVPLPWLHSRREGPRASSTSRFSAWHRHLSTSRQPLRPPRAPRRAAGVLRADPADPARARAAGAGGRACVRSGSERVDLAIRARRGVLRAADDQDAQARRVLRARRERTGVRRHARGREPPSHARPVRVSEHHHRRGSDRDRAARQREPGRAARGDPRRHGGRRRRLRLRARAVGAEPRRPAAGADGLEPRALRAPRRVATTIRPCRSTS